jgi:anti-sigma-K factor RskA
VIDQPAAVSPPTLSAAEVTALVGLFQGMLMGTESRILAAMADNSRAAAERWAKHDAELAANTERVTKRFAELDSRLETTAAALKSYLDREHDDDIRMDARIRPIRGSIGWLWAHWRDVVLLTIGLIALGTFLVDFFGHTFGLQP